MHSDNYLKWFDRHGKKRPDHFEHGLDSKDDPISKKLKKLKPSSWRMEGNKLIGETEMGSLVQFLPTNIICTGTDEEGMPILQKIKI